MDIRIGLDTGFGDVKVVVNLNGTTRELKYPTAIAYAKKGIIGDLGDRQEEYDFSGQTFVVGAAALQSQDLFSTRDIEFLLTYSPLLAYKALVDIAQAGSLPLADLLSTKKQLCLGVPLAHYTRKEELKNRLAAYSVSGDTVQFDSVEVRAQSQGILFDYMLNKDGKSVSDRMNQNLLIIDIGFNTVDVLGVINGRPSKEWSGMLESSGICKVCEELKNHLQTEFSFNLFEQVVKDVLERGQISLYGVTKDLSSPIRIAKEVYSNWLSREINSRWNNFIKRADKLIIAGGGAYFVDDLKQRYPKEFVFVPDNPEYSNARGFLKFGLAGL